MINVNRILFTREKEKENRKTKKQKERGKEKFGHALLGLFHTAQIIVALSAEEL
jgi:hypothetical protein